MNILHITNHLDIGGITSYVLTLSGGLKKKGYNIYLASSGGALLDKFREIGVNYFPIPIRTKSEASPKIIFSLFKLSRLVKKYNIELVHAHSRTTQVLGFWLGKACGIPYVSTCHGFFKPRLFRKAFGCWGKKVIAISEQVRDHLINDFKVERGRIVVIHNGVDIEKFGRRTSAERSEASPKGTDDGRRTRQKLGLSGAPVISIIARLSEEKGHDDLVRAMPGVLKEFPQAQLLIVGSGRTEAAIKKLTKELGLEKSVIFSPAVSDTAEVLAITDVFVLPSLKEGLGLALIEAMAAGCAVVGAAVGGIKSLIKDKVNGLLIEPRDTAGLSRALLELLRDKNKAAALGEAAQDFIKNNFSQGEMASQTERAYVECLSAKE